MFFAIPLLLFIAVITIIMPRLLFDYMMPYHYIIIMTPTSHWVLLEIAALFRH